ncbi:MAG: SRPBCC family protein [Deltaproteobacteria bacterium]|nr:SRPBCC family protein [Deltaproteobacteria bacterium]
MTKPKFVYVTYIATTRERVWKALTDSEMTKEYWWRRANVSDWKVGSAWKHQDYDDPRLVDIVGQVVESNPPHRLVVTWARPVDAGNAAKTSRVTYQIEPYADVVRLTVMHEELEPDSDMLRGITSGWPAVLSSLKTFLETGKPMSTMTQRRDRPPE